MERDLTYRQPPPDAHARWQAIRARQEATGETHEEAARAVDAELDEKGPNVSET